MSFAHGAGSYVFTLFDDFSGNFPLLIIAFFECVAISYIYGIKRYKNSSKNVRKITGVVSKLVLILLGQTCNAIYWNSNKAHVFYSALPFQQTPADVCMSNVSRVTPVL